MFKDREMEAEIRRLKESVDYLQSANGYPIIGGVFGVYEYKALNRWAYPAVPSSVKRWNKFRQSDVSESVGNNIKIFDTWYKRADVFYYDDVYKSLRNKIEKRNEVKK